MAHGIIITAEIIYVRMHDFQFYVYEKFNASVFHVAWLCYEYTDEHKSK